MANKITTDPNANAANAANNPRRGNAAANAVPTPETTEYGLLEDPDLLAERLSHTEDFVKKHKNTLIGVFAVLALLVAGGFFYYSHKQSQEVEAQQAMFQAVYNFEADSLNLAIKGDARSKGLKYIASEYSGTKAANLASLYLGIAQLKQGQYKEAIESLEDFSSDDLIMQGRAYCLIGDAQMELGNKKEAAEQYMKAANYKANEQFSPAYLMKAGMAYEANNQFKEAGEAYDKIITTYATAPEVNDAKKYKARAEALAGN